MPIEIEKEDGTKQTVFTDEDVTARVKTEIEKVQADTTKTVAEKDKEIERLNKLNIDKTQNFKKYNEMSADEKAAYDANTTELLKRNESVETELGTLKEKLDLKEKAERESAKSSALKPFHEGDDKLKATMEEKYALLSAMPETTPEEISARATEAAKLAGISIDSRNPLHIPFSGEAPRYQANKEYTETPQGKEAAELVRKAMNIPAAK